MGGRNWNRVLAGDGGAAPWITVRATRTVLAVVHTVTALNRFADVLSVFDSDRRVQLVFTFPDASLVPGDVERDLVEQGAVVIPWDQAIRTRFDLAISVHNSGDLHRIVAPLVVLPHGMGYTKRRNTGIPEYRNTGIPEPGPVYGLAPEWLMRDGRVVPEVVVLSHEEQRARLAAATPQAADRAVTTGDPCFDRMRASPGSRDEYRRMLGAGDGTTVVVVSSTWGGGSLLGRHPDLVSDLLAELTMDDHVVAAVLHPNVWFAHGPWQIRYWFAEALRSGLRLIPPARGWQQAVVAADVVIGDHGAVTGYSAALGVPTLLAAFPRDEVAQGSAIEELGRSAPALRPDEPFQDQIRAVQADYHPARSAGVAALTSSAPDEAAQLLRATFYRLMDLSLPDHDVPVLPYRPEDLRPTGEEVRASWVACDWTDGSRIHVRRWPADVTARRRHGPRGTEAHLTVHSEHPRRDLRTNATVVVLPDEPHPSRVRDRLAAVLRERVACTVATAAISNRRYLVRHRDHGHVAVRVLAPQARPVDPAAVASAIHFWWDRHSTLRDRLPTVLTLSLGSNTVRLELTAL